jgi:Protein of unknown function (DUF1579)
VSIGKRLFLRASARVLGVLLLGIACRASAQEATQVTDPSKTIYGEKSPRAPKQLDEFAFLIGSWEGKGRTKLEDDKVAEFSVTWIGRYILDGTAIADEAHSIAPDGSPYLGITLRQYDQSRQTWVIEFLNVSNSFLRKQVNGTAGSVSVQGRLVTVASSNPGMMVREHYDVVGKDRWTYRLDVSRDGGERWNEGMMQITFQRAR